MHPLAWCGGKELPRHDASWIRSDGWPIDGVTPESRR